MSILLDALKKSEAQRRLGETPTLQTSVSMDEENSADRQHWIPLAMILLSAGIMTWTGIAQFRPVDSLPVSAQPDGESSRAVVKESGAAAISTPRGAEEPFPRSIRTPSQARTRTAATTPVKDYVVDDRPPVSPVSPPANSAVEAVETASPQSADAPDAAGEGASAIEAGSASSRGVTHVEIGANAGSRESSSTAPPASAPLEVAGPDDYAPQTISYWQVPHSLREEMGEFRISVLVYAENPADRFLLVNGKRLREQEETEGGVRLEVIERDRAVFTYRNYRFHLQN